MAHSQTKLFNTSCRRNFSQNCVAQKWQNVILLFYEDLLDSVSLPGHPNVPCIISVCIPNAHFSHVTATFPLWVPPAAGQGPELLTSQSNIRLWLPIAAPLFPGRQVPPPLDVLKRVGGWRGSIWRRGWAGLTKRAFLRKLKAQCSLEAFMAATWQQSTVGIS